MTPLHYLMLLLLTVTVAGRGMLDTDSIGSNQTSVSNSTDDRATMLGQYCYCCSYVRYVNGKKSKTKCGEKYQYFSYGDCPSCCYYHSASSRYKRYCVKSTSYGK